MWVCPTCGATSFPSRSKCFVCERRRPRDAEEVEERWISQNLPNRDPARPPPHGSHRPSVRDGPPPQQRHQQVILRGRDVRQHAADGPRDERAPRAVPRRAAAAAADAGHAAAARADDHDDDDAHQDESDITGDELSYLNIVRKTAKPKGAAKAKAKATAAAAPQQQQPCHPGQQQQAQPAQEAGDMEEGQPLPVPPKPFEAPPLPRGLLAARSAALEAKIADKRAMGATSEEIAKLEARLGSTKQMLKVAGGGTHRKLHFEMLEAERKVTRLVKAVEAAEAEVAEAESGVLAAIERRDHATAALAAEHGKLHNARDHHAHLTLQAAAEASAHSSRYAAMHSSMLELQGILGNIGGMEHAVAGLAQVTDFLQTFLPVHYSVDHDPMLDETIGQRTDDDDYDINEGAAATEAQDSFKMVDAVAQAQADVDELRRQANDAAAQAVRDAAARAVAVVTGATVAEVPSHTDAVQQFADRIKQAEANLQRAKDDRANEAKQKFPPSPPPVLASSAASVPEGAAAATVPGASTTVSTGLLPAAFGTAEKVATLPVPPESSLIPAAFATGTARHSLHRTPPKFEGRFPPAQGGPRGRARSTESARGRRRSRSTPGAAIAEKLDDMGDQIMGGADRGELVAQPASVPSTA